MGIEKYWLYNHKLLETIRKKVEGRQRVSELAIQRPSQFYSYKTPSSAHAHTCIHAYIMYRHFELKSTMNMSMSMKMNPNT